MKPSLTLSTLLQVVALLVLAAQARAAQPSREDLQRAAKLIREEGMERSQIMETLSYLTEVVGPRLTASPGHKRANDWTRDRLAAYGLANAHLEAWGPFGRGWTVKSFTAQVVEPQNIQLLAYPKAWSPGLDQPLVADVLLFNPTNTADLERFKGKLKGAIVLTSPIREIRPRFEPLATRMTETNLLRLANAGLETRSTYGSRASAGPPGALQRTPPAGEGTASEPNPAPSPNPPPATPTNAPPSRGGPSSIRNLRFLADEGVALVASVSPMGDGGIVFVSSASVPPPASTSTNTPRSFADMPRPWSTNASFTLPQIAVAAEDYNRIARMIQRGQKLRMAVDFRVRFHEDDLMAYNTIAEIPGTDLKHEIVMVGGHLDSWHAGTGATDNAIGVAAAMEAVRIIKTLKLEPRRTIRVGLWAGEEQGLLGSRAYVSQHFGYYTNLAEPAPPLLAPKDERPPPQRSAARATSNRQLVRLGDYDNLCAYFNLDNGAGRIRGIHLQGNEAVLPIFRRWLEPFRDLDAVTISLSNTRGTDHLSFDSVGLPGFQFIQDPLDYNTRTHHSNQDLLERIVPEDAQQAAVILASFAYNAAMLDEKLPRKPLD